MENMVVSIVVSSAVTLTNLKYVTSEVARLREVYLDKI